MTKKICFLLFLLAKSLGSVSQIPTTGLLAYYPFCGNANDLSANSLNGTVFGATLCQDRFNNINSAYSFDGSLNNYISLPPSTFIGLNVYSYSIWLRPTSNIVSIPYSIGSNDPYCQSLSFNTTSVSAGSYNVGSSPLQSYVFSNTLQGINNWIHVVVTRDQTYLKMYVNGVLLPQLPSALTNGQSANYGSTPPYRAILGARSTLNQYFYTGDIDDVRIYSTILSQNDVNALYNETFILTTNSGTICQGNSYTISPSGALTYSYSGNSNVVTPVTSSNYTVTGGYGNGCVSSAISSVTVIPSPTLIVNSGVICLGDSFTFQPFGAVSYTISSGTVIVSPTLSTTYTITGSNTTCTASLTASVSVFPLPTITVNGGTICAGSSFTLAPSGAASYTFSSGSAVVSPITNTSYTINGSNGVCTAVVTTSVAVERCTGLSENQSSDLKIRIYPNPNNGAFTVEVPALDQTGVFIIQDPQGKTIYSYPLNDNQNERLVFDYPLAPGCYLGKICVNTKTSSIFKIIITPF